MSCLRDVHPPAQAAHTAGNPAAEVAALPGARHRTVPRLPPTAWAGRTAPPRAPRRVRAHRWRVCTCTCRSALAAQGRAGPGQARGSRQAVGSRGRPALGTAARHPGTRQGAAGSRPAGRGKAALHAWLPRVGVRAWRVLGSGGGEGGGGGLPSLGVHQHADEVDDNTDDACDANANQGPGLAAPGGGVVAVVAIAVPGAWVVPPIVYSVIAVALVNANSSHNHHSDSSTKDTESYSSS
eukprot:CAMPEP_0202864416 /NCGR_PEP_ID=MMETSP1391-20130828/4663_1 /ASSEMBLY_ACC=CAM_ASM_000867 /TAXON_ID=1034604 /ORGANISM="Chlamydomonas leiostraca, Strain SAG 11-49" /LENGTH=238 /DNA_ID=CAMNT_0049544151 /DNA_START=839 /DNA_END=1556 /DNA_ORIENTATION=+